MTVAVNWRENGELFNDERSLTADSDFRRFGGRDYRSPASNPGTVYSLEGCPPGPDSVCLSSLEVRGNLPGLDSPVARSEEHTSELQSLMRISYAVFCLNKKK